jgi:ribonuclease HI
MNALTWLWKCGTKGCRLTWNSRKPVAAALTVMAELSGNQELAASVKLASAMLSLNLIQRTIQKSGVLTHITPKAASMATLAIFISMAPGVGADTFAQHADSPEWSSFSPYIIPTIAGARNVWDKTGQWVEDRGTTMWDDLLEGAGSDNLDPLGSPFAGDDMTQKMPQSGLRVLTINSGRSLLGQAVTEERTSSKGRKSKHKVTALTMLVASMAKTKTDIAVIHEPGIYRRGDSAIEIEIGVAWKHFFVKRDDLDRGGGTLILVSAPWAVCMVEKGPEEVARKSTQRSGGGAKFDQDRLVTLEFKNPNISNPAKRDKKNERLLLLASYCYNTTNSHTSPWGSNQREQQHLTDAITTSIKSYRARFPKATVLLAGDLNCVNHVELDTLPTDSPHSSIGKACYDSDLTRRGVGHGLLDSLVSVGLQDMFRERHPWTRAATRYPIGNQWGGPRRLDQLWATAEVAQSNDSAIWIKLTSDSIHSDHREVIAEIPLNLARIASRHTPIWSKNSETKLRLKMGLTDSSQEVRGYHDSLASVKLKAKAKSPQHQPHPLTQRDMNSEFDAINSLIHAKAVPSIMEKQRIESPKFVNKVKDMSSTDWKLNVRRRHLRHTKELIFLGREDDEINKALSSTPKSPILDAKAKEVVTQGWSPESLKHLLQTEGQLTLQENILEEIASIDKWLSARARSERTIQINDSVTHRIKMFDLGRVGTTVRSIFRRTMGPKATTWLTDTTGRLRSTPEQVKEAVHQFTTDWMASKVGVEERFGDMDAMLDWDLSALTPDQRESVDTFYHSGDKSATYYNSPEMAHIWKDIQNPITLEELDKSLRSFATGKAQGPSQIPPEAMRWMPDNHRQRILALLNKCLQTGQFPSSANAAKMWLVPKNEQGNTDLTQTRPIALMETLAKTYEQILCTRILEVMMKNEMFDRSQHGALPEGGTEDPMLTLALLMEDARLSGNTAYILSLDLSKAFDTIEFWSQALSWRAFGMPKHMVKLLLQMDTTATTQVALGAGQYTNPVSHGRGVRQGSCGGPLKWIVFMHWWLVGVKHQMKGHGYKMSATPSTEFTAQMFVDDSNWATATRDGMQTMVKLIERWVNFHALKINAKKTELLVVNPEEGSQDHPIKWEDGTPIIPNSETKPTRYLGAHYTVAGDWGHESTIITGKLKSLLDTMLASARSLTIREARYLINRKILPSILHATKVATLEPPILKYIDSKIRQAFCKCAGVSQQDTPLEWFHLPLDQGGWGVNSFTYSYHAQVVQVWTTALNSPRTRLVRAMADAAVISHKRIKRQADNPFAGTAREVTAASRDRTQAKKLATALLALDLELRTTDQSLTNPADSLSNPAWQTALKTKDRRTIAAQDIKTAQSQIRKGHVKAYTDGSTTGANWGKPVCGWGVHMESEGRPHVQLKGKVSVLPTNFAAESEAVLEALLATHTTDALFVHIDNMSVVDLATEAHNHPDLENDHELQHAPARTLWSRIQAIIQHRHSLGTPTRFLWVHSHVDKEDRQIPTTSDHTCACHDGAQFQIPKRCKPNHPAHRGNAKADVLADQGAAQIPREHTWKGEVRIFPSRTVGPTTGDTLKDVLQLAVTHSLKEAACVASKIRATRARAALEASDPAMRKKAMKLAASKSSDLSERFMVRLWMDVLPTYGILAKRIWSHKSEDSKFRDMYTPEGESSPVVDSVGTCPLCQCSPETIPHLLVTCTHDVIADIRMHTDTQAESIAHFHGVAEWWARNKWNTTSTTWNESWGRTGLVPVEAFESLLNFGACEQTTGKFISDIQRLLQEAARKTWEARNTITLQKEEDQGLKETKAHVIKTGDTFAREARKGKRALPKGRPKMQPEDLARSTKRARARQEEKTKVTTQAPPRGQTAKQWAISLKRSRTHANNTEDAGNFQVVAKRRNQADPDLVDPAVKNMNRHRIHRTPCILESNEIGIGSIIQVQWPTVSGRASMWQGTVRHLVPGQGDVRSQIIEYDNDPGALYEHALWAGETKFTVIKGKPVDPNASCQQGTAPACGCAADLGPGQHNHPWYCSDTAARASCYCTYCMYANQFDLSRVIQAGDYDAGGAETHSTPPSSTSLTPDQKDLETDTSRAVAMAASMAATSMEAASMAAALKARAAAKAEKQKEKKRRSQEKKNRKRGNSFSDPPYPNKKRGKPTRYAGVTETHPGTNITHETHTGNVQRGQGPAAGTRSGRRNQRDRPGEAAQIPQHPEAPAEINGSSRGDEGSPAQNASSGGDQDHGPRERFQKELGAVGEQAPGHPDGYDRTDVTLDRRQSQEGHQNHCSPGEIQLQETAQESRRPPTSPDSGNQLRAPITGDARQSPPGSIGARGDQPILGRPELRCPRDGEGASTDPRRHPARILPHAGLPTSDSKDVHGPQSGPGGKHGAMDSDTRGDPGKHDLLSARCHTVPHLDKPEQHAQSTGERVPRQKRKSNQKEGPEERRSDLADRPGKKHCNFDCRLGAKRSDPRMAEVLCDREPGVRNPQDPEVHGFPPEAEGSSVLHVRDLPGRSRDVPVPQAYRNLDKRKRLEPEDLPPHRPARSNNRRTHQQKTRSDQSDGQVHTVGSEAMDTRSPDPGDPSAHPRKRKVESTSPSQQALPAKRRKTITQQFAWYAQKKRIAKKGALTEEEIQVIMAFFPGSPDDL